MYSFENIDKSYVTDAHKQKSNNGTHALMQEIFIALPNSFKPNNSSEVRIQGRTFTVTISAGEKLEARQFVETNSGLITFHLKTQKIYVIHRDNLILSGTAKGNALKQVVRNASLSVWSGLSDFCLSLDGYEDLPTPPTDEDRLKVEVTSLRQEVSKLKNTIKELEGVLVC